MTIQEKAFPNPHLTNETGMTLRDYFAAKAMQGMLAACTGWETQQERLTKCSYAIADAMMEARNAKQ
jgi:hypothetical protein